MTKDAGNKKNDFMKTNYTKQQVMNVWGIRLTMPEKPEPKPAAKINHVSVLAYLVLQQERQKYENTHLRYRCHLEAQDRQREREEDIH